MRYAVLKTGRATRATRERIGEMDAQFIALLADDPGQWDVYDVEQGEFPQDPGAYRGFVITGSPAGVHDKVHWLPPLLALARDIHERGIALLGVCFGAQVCAQALGGEVKTNPRGWDIGLTELQLTPDGGRLPLLNTAPRPLHILETHQDIVTRLPPGGRCLASSALTPHEIFTVGQNTLCLQGHPEMDNAVVEDLIQSFTQRELITVQRGEEAQASLAGLPERAFFQGWLRTFLREGRVSRAA